MRESGRLRVFWVGDNRTTPNWGRAASLALSQMLEEKFGLTGRVTGDFFEASVAATCYVGTLLPPKYARYYRWSLNRRDRWPISWYVALEQRWGARDFVAEDPATTVDNIFRYKDRHPALAAICDQAIAADFIVIDGDGDIVFTTPPRRQTLFLLAMIELGIRIRKPVYLVNTMVSDCPSSGRNLKTVTSARRLFALCEAVALRDPESLEYVCREMPETRASYIPDSLFSWFTAYTDERSRPPVNGDFLFPFPEEIEYWGKLDFSVPYICVGGGALASCQPGRAVERYTCLVKALLRLGYRVYLTENDLPDSFLRRVARETGTGLVPVTAPILTCGAVLAHAALFVSGRYHPSILASLGGTPCICLGSHAHKMNSFHRIMDNEPGQSFSGLPCDDEITAIVARSRELLDAGEPLRRRIRGVAHQRCCEAKALPGFLQQHMMPQESVLQLEG